MPAARVNVAWGCQYANYPSPWAVFSAINTDSLFICPARRTARWATSAGLSAYVYVCVVQWAVAYTTCG